MAKKKRSISELESEVEASRQRIAELEQQVRQLQSGTRSSGSGPGGDPSTSKPAMQ